MNTLEKSWIPDHDLTLLLPGCFGSMLQDTLRAIMSDRIPKRELPDHAGLAELLARIAGHRDRTAFAQLFQYFAPRVKAYLMRGGASGPAAEEIIQDVMLTIWHRADQFEPDRATVSTWVFTIARNRRIDIIRRDNRLGFDATDPALHPSEPVLPDARLELWQTETQLIHALGQLPAEQAKLLEMAYFQDKSHRSIADETGLPLGTVKSRIRLGLARLRLDLGPEEI